MPISAIKTAIADRCACTFLVPVFIIRLLQADIISLRRATDLAHRRLRRCRRILAAATATTTTARMWIEPKHPFGRGGYCLSTLYHRDRPAPLAKPLGRNIDLPACRRQQATLERKVRALEIISELEPDARGAYAGMVGYFGFDGNLDTCLAIRTMVGHGNTFSVQAGAGIVADSDPATEYQETVNKATAMLKAIEVAETK